MIGADGSEELAAIEKILRMKFNQTETGWVNERCESVLSDYTNKAKTARENGKLGGRPRKNNPVGSYPVAIGMQSGTYEETSSNPAETGSQANQEPITNNHKPETRKTKTTPSPVGDDILFPNVSAGVVSDFKAHRKARKAPVSLAAMKLMVTEASKAGISLESAMELCCLRGWTGFKAEWVAPRNAQVTTRTAATPSRHSGFDNLDYTEGVEDGRF